MLEEMRIKSEDMDETMSEPIDQMWRCGSVVDWTSAERARLCGAWASMSHEGKMLGTESWSWPVGVASAVGSLALGMEMLPAFAIGITASVWCEMGAGFMASQARSHALSVLQATGHAWRTEVERRGGDLSVLADEIKPSPKGWGSSASVRSNASLEMMAVRASGLTSGGVSLGLMTEGHKAHPGHFGALCLALWNVMFKKRGEGRFCWKVSQHESRELAARGLTLTLKIMPMAASAKEAEEIEAAIEPCATFSRASRL